MGHMPGGPERLQLPWSPDWHCLLCLAHATPSVVAAADAAAEVAADSTEHHAGEVAALSEYTAMSLRAAEGVELAVGTIVDSFLEGGKGLGYGMRKGGTSAGFDTPEGPVVVGWAVRKVDGGIVQCVGEHWQAAAHLSPQA